MAVKTAHDSGSIPSLFRGGPTYRAMLATGLIKDGEWNHTRRVIIAIAVGWVPLVLLTVFFDPNGLVSLLTDYRVYSRLLIAVPVLLLGQPLMESRFNMAVQAISNAHLVSDGGIRHMDRISESMIRLRDAFTPEAIIVVLLTLHTLTALKTQLDIEPWLSYGMQPNDVHLTAAGWYAVVVSATLFQFLLGLSLWKWLLLTIFAFQLSRLKLQLVATHPDGHGGLGFLGLVPAGFTPVSFAAATVIGANWRHEILEHGAKLKDFKLEAIVLVAIVALMALGPLVFFIPRLAELRREGILEYGALGQIQSLSFHEKWILHRTGHDAEFLEAPESSTLSNFGAAFANVAKLKPLPLDSAVLIVLAISLAVPLLPAVLAVIPLVVVLQDLLKALH